jgi:hypothetical protein
VSIEGETGEDNDGNQGPGSSQHSSGE